MRPIKDWMWNVSFSAMKQTRLFLMDVMNSHPHELLFWTLVAFVAKFL